MHDLNDFRRLTGGAEAREAADDLRAAKGIVLALALGLLAWAGIFAAVLL